MELEGRHSLGSLDSGENIFWRNSDPNSVSALLFSAGISPRMDTPSSARKVRADSCVFLLGSVGDSFGDRISL